MGSTIISPKEEYLSVHNIDFRLDLFAAITYQRSSLRIFMLQCSVFVTNM